MQRGSLGRQVTFLRGQGPRLASLSAGQAEKAAGGHPAESAAWRSPGGGA